jgi:hypothetical protein
MTSRQAFLRDDAPRPSTEPRAARGHRAVLRRHPGDCGPAPHPLLSLARPGRSRRPRTAADGARRIAERGAEDAAHALSWALGAFRAPAEV